jgi:hypothetical protein
MTVQARADAALCPGIRRRWPRLSVTKGWGTAPGELGVMLGLLKDDDGEGAQLALMPGLADLLELVESCWRLSSPAAS